MIPEGRLSEVPVAGEFLSPDDLVPVAPPETDTPYDWEMGGIALNDASQGLQVQVWEFYLQGASIMAKPANGPAVEVYRPGLGVTELSGCFDSNMNPTLVWVQGGTVWLRWWNATTADFSLSTLPALTSPRLTLDDKRPTQDGNRDILLLYIRDGNIYYRMQRQRYQDENFLYPVPKNFAALTRVGMSNVGRLQIELRGTEYCGGGFIDAVGCSNADWCRAPCDTEVWAQAPCAAGNWVAAPCVSGDWDQEFFYPCPPKPACSEVYLNKDAVTTELSWSSDWDANDNAEIVLNIEVGQPYSVQVSGYTSAGYDLSDVLQEFGSGSNIEAVDANGHIVGYIEPVTQDNILLLTFVDNASLQRLRFHTNRPLDDRQGFGFAFVGTACGSP